jgi:diadenosine tetraphosphate (Ap4A) HIT family hydrolase
MPPRSLSDEKYLLDLAAQVLAEPDYLWQHCFPGLVGDPGTDGRPRPLPVDGYFPRHRLIVEYWEKQHSAPVSIMDEGQTVSGVSRGHQRRLYDQRRQAFADANGLRLVILDYRGFDAHPSGRLRRDPVRDVQIVASALRAAGVVAEPQRAAFRAASGPDAGGEGCMICRIVEGTGGPQAGLVLWRDDESIAFLSRFPAAYGHAVVAPTRHREQVSGDLTLHQYLGLHRVVHAVAEAVRLALAPERVYILSIGSQPLEAHIQWQVVPCPPGLPLEQQQLALLEAAGTQPLQLSTEDAEQLAAQLRSHLPAWMRGRTR